MSLLTQGTPKVTNKTYGRKPYIKGEIGDYAEMLSTVSRSSVENEIEIPRSQFDKPYLSPDYANQEYVFPPPIPTPYLPNYKLPSQHSVSEITSELPGGMPNFQIKPPDYCCECAAVRELWGKEEPLSEHDVDAFTTAGVRFTVVNDTLHYKLSDTGLDLEASLYKSLSVTINGNKAKKAGYYPNIDHMYPFRIWPDNSCWRNGDIIEVSLNIYKDSEKQTIKNTIKREVSVSCGVVGDGNSQSQISQKDICCNSCKVPATLTIDRPGPIDSECGSYEQFFLSGGVPPFTITPSGGILVKNTKGDYTSDPVTTCRDEIWVECPSGDDCPGSASSFFVHDACGQEIEVEVDCSEEEDCCEDPGYTFELDTDSTPDSMAKGTCITIYVMGGCPPYTFETSSLGYTFEGSGSYVTDDPSASLCCADGTCKTNFAAVCDYTVTDACGTIVTGVVRNTSGGRWIAIGNFYACCTSGVLHICPSNSCSAAGYTEIIEGKYKWHAGIFDCRAVESTCSFAWSKYMSSCSTLSFPPPPVSPTEWVSDRSCLPVVSSCSPHNPGDCFVMSGGAYVWKC